MFITDGHLDIGTGYLYLGRDFLQSCYAVRKQEKDSERPFGTCTVGLPEVRGAGIRLIFGTLYVAPWGQHFKGKKIGYRNPEEAAKQAEAQIQYYREIARADQGVRIVESRSDLDSLEEGQEGELGIVVLLEGAEPVIEPEDFPLWFESGVRIVSPAWKKTRYCGGTGAPGPLTPLGEKLLEEMERVGAILDVSHMAEESFFQALEAFRGSVLASHSNCRMYAPGDRHLSDEMIKTLVERGAVIGVVCANEMIQGGWDKAKNERLPLADLAKHIDHMCQLAGNADHTAIGSDMDGGFGVESLPVEMDSIRDLPLLAQALEKKGYPAEDIQKIMGKNWMRFMERALP